MPVLDCRKKRDKMLSLSAGQKIRNSKPEPEKPEPEPEKPEPEKPEP